MSVAKRISVCLLSMLAVGAGPQTQLASETPATQTEASIDVKLSIRFLEYVPPGYAADPQNAKDGDGHGWPLVLFLHGAGERGRNLNDVKRQGLPKLIARGKQFPFIVISPQVDPGEWWNAPLLNKLLDEMERKYKVDPDRIYVTGLSMGGFGTFDLARRTPERFAAIAPICGGGEADLLKLIPGMKTLPVWAFHGDKDNVVPLHHSVEMIDALKAMGNTDAKLTIYPGVGHDSWTKAYDDPELYRWLLSHRRGKPTTEPATQPAK